MSLIIKDLKNKNVVITGGLGFLGSQFSSAFIKNQSNVFILDIKPKNKINKKLQLSNYFNYFKCDITNEQQVLNTLKKITKKFKKIDVLINNAFDDYIPKKVKKNEFSLEHFKEDKWDRDLSVGLKGVFLCTKVFGNSMKKNANGGRIINISSDLGIISPDQRIYKKVGFHKPVTYSVIKHGVIGLTKYVATHWAKNKITCNAIAPGGMHNNQNKFFIKEIKKLIPLNRMGKFNEYNSLVLFLASDQSSYITGSTVVIDGGRTIW
jgi:NAD(P)-dependent dehydrogenase (short-subunit alcohol dehydrogenase family)